MDGKAWRWVLGLTYIIAVAAIWIAASFVVQSVVDAGVSPFLITYICNSLFVIYIPLVELGRYLEDNYGGLWFRGGKKTEESGESEKAILLGDGGEKGGGASLAPLAGGIGPRGEGAGQEGMRVAEELERPLPDRDGGDELAAKRADAEAEGRWTRTRMAKVSLLICPFWFLAQLSFNLSLKYTTVTVPNFRIE